MQKGAVMVTGGSGFIGQAVVKRLVDQGRTVVSVYHHKLPDSLDNVYPVCSDIGSAELMAAPLRGVDTVIHLAWSGGLAGSPQSMQADASRPETFTGNLQMLRNTLRAMEKAGTRRVVFLSANGASRHSEVPFLREKYAAEALVLNSAVPERVVFRTTVVWGGQGNNDPFLRSIIRVMKYPVYPLPKKPGGMAPLHVRDLADILVSSCSQSMKGSASLLEINGGEAYQLGELFKIVSETYVKRTQFAVGGFLADSLLPLLERDRSSAPVGTKLQHFLAIGGAGNDGTRLANPLVSALPRRLATFKEKIVE